MPFPIGPAISLVGTLFGGNPKTAERRAKADQLYQQALNGNVMAEVQLRILSKIADPRGITYGFVTPQTLASGAFGWATVEAREYGAGLAAELEKRRAGGQLADSVVAPLPPPGSAAAAPKPSILDTVGTAISTLLGSPPAPPVVPGQASPQAPATQAGILSAPSWFLPAVIGGGVLWLVSRRGKPGRGR